MTTLADVARLANVSKMTVSRVINHPEQVTQELRTLVTAAMEELHYKPNVAAKALAEKRTFITYKSLFWRRWTMWSLTIWTCWQELRMS